MVNGACMPLFSIIFGKLTDSFNDPCACSDTDTACIDACNSDRLDSVAKYALWFIYLGIIAFFCSWYEHMYINPLILYLIGLFADM
jgi:hypothetical protein